MALAAPDEGQTHSVSALVFLILSLSKDGDRAVVDYRTILALRQAQDEEFWFCVGYENNLSDGAVAIAEGAEIAAKKLWG